RLLRQISGPRPVREGLLSARGVSVLLARLRDARRLLRLLSRVPRVLEALWDRSPRQRAQEGLLRERAADNDTTPADRLATLSGSPSIVLATIAARVLTVNEDDYASDSSAPLRRGGVPRTRNWQRS